MDNVLLILILLLVLLVVSIVVFVMLVRRSQQQAEPVEVPPPEKDTVSADVRQAVAALRDRVPGGRFQDRVPWILLVGEAGAGKTTLLDQMSTGSAGTPSPKEGVQWRFLDGGALIDVPGSFLVGPGGKGQADGRWQRLLRLLMRHRPARPVDGIVLAVPASLLMPVSETEAAQVGIVAAAMRNKLDDLQKLLGMVVPVYVLVTKCDQIRGFGSFCWEINPDLDDDVFGWSNPNTLESAFSADWIDNAYDSILDGILRQQMRIFGSCAPSASCDEMFVFPMEFDRTRNALRDYLSQIFRETSYLDSNFLRGIYFCGDAAIVRDRLLPAGAGRAAAVSLVAGAVSAPLGGWAGIASAQGSSFSTAIAPLSVYGVKHDVRYGVGQRGGVAQTGRQIVFARHLFDFKVFQESKIGRPIARTRFTRNRAVLAAQIALAVFVLVFGIGTFVAWQRLADLRDHRFSSLLDALTDTLPTASNATPKVPAVQTAYDLVDTLGTVNGSGFKSFFLPASWNDPIGGRITDALTEAFGRTVFPAIRQGLDTRARTIIADCAVAAPADDKTVNSDAPGNGNVEGVSGIAPISFTKDPAYAALSQFVSQFSALDTAMRHYDNLRRMGTGTFSDLDALFQYLIGKNLSDSQRTTKSFYYQHALADASSQPLPVTSNNYLNDCAQKRAGSLVDNFYASWLDNNPLLTRSNNIAVQVDNLEKGRVSSSDDLSSMSLDIRDLDAEVSTNGAGWLTGSGFDAGAYPALNQLKSARFATEDFNNSVAMKGSAALTRLKGELFTTGTAGTGAVLGVQGTELHVAGAVVSLELAVEALLHEDFMQSADGGTTSSAAINATASSTSVIWNKSTLARAGQLKDSYDKFVRERLALLPPALRTPLQRIATQNLTSAVRAAVARAQEPQTGDDDATTLLEIKSFKDAVPVLTQLQSAVPGTIVASSGGAGSTLAAQSLALAQRLNNDLDSTATYPYSLAALNTWDGSKPLSYAVFGADSADGIEQYLATQHDRIKSLALDYAQPLAAYLQPQGLVQAAKFARWTAVIRDVQDYDAKKPGNPILSLETFIRTDLDKITPANSCHAVSGVAQSNDYFLQIRADVQRAAMSACSGSTIRGYTSGLADFFNARLAGKFPFGPLPTTPGAAQADPQDTAKFLSLIGQRGPALVNFLATQPAYADILDFINQADAVRQMFAGGLSDGAPFADVVVYFRVNQNAEQNGNEIIDWEFGSADQKVHFPGTVNGVRWHYGDDVKLTMRYAKDSPDIPQAGAAGADARVDGRTVTWDSAGGWSLFALLSRHAGTSSDFGTTPEALASTMRFVIPNSRPAPSVPQPVDTRVYIRLGLKIPGAKDTREIPVVSFPVKAPAVPSGPASLTPAAVTP